MLEPTAPVRLSVVALAASGVFLTACQRQAAPTPANPPPIVEAPAAAPAMTPPVMDREQILQAVDAAASDYAASRAPDSPTLAGRRFVIRQAFGCAGAAPPLAKDAPGDGIGRWTWGQAHQTIDIRLAPGDWTGSPLIAGGPETWEVVEGFWLTRPWLRSGECPAVAADPLASGPATPSPQTVGLAVVFEKGGSRLERRNGREYAFVLRGGDKQPLAAPASGLRLVLEGRLIAFGDGRAISCRAAAPDQRPVCIAAAQVDRVAFEDASGATLSEWRSG
jgi:hypothetical protein